MNNHLLALFLFIFTTALLCKALEPYSALADSATPTELLPKHTVSISFELEKSQLIGTSSINLPPGTPLTLHCGPLTITGSILERQDHTPLQVMADRENIIRIPAAEKRQNLLLSWIMAAENPYADSNLVSRDGITLAGFWHPIPEQDMLYELWAALPPGFTGISEAGEVKMATKQNICQFQTAFPNPLRVLHFSAGPYIIQSRKEGDVTIYSYFFKEDQRLAPEYLKEAARYIKRYETLLGPFPYPRYSIVENRLPTGYGMPGFTLLGQAVIRLPFIKDTSLGHEILHSWFGNSVGLAESGGNWCEGLTSYLADQSFAEDQGKGAEHRKHQLLRYEAFVHPGNTMTLSEFSEAGDNRPMAKKIRAIGYDKGSMVFHMLRKEIGDKAFFLALRNLYYQKKNQRASWHDLEKAFSSASGKDLQPFFQQWLERTDSPQLNIQEISMEQDGGQSSIRFHLVQETEQPYSMQVPVVIKTLTGDVLQTITTDQLDQVFTITTDTLPTELILDPDYDLFRQLAEEEIPPTWSRFLGAEKKTVVLPDDTGQAAVYQPLAEMLQAKGVEVKTASEASNEDIAGGSFLFCGDSVLRRSLFADNHNADSGFSLQTRKNPLNYEQTLVLVDSSSTAETRAVLRKLSHYGKYSRLYFKGGKIIDKQTDPSENGYRLPLLPPPAAIPVQAVQDFSFIVDDITNSRVVYVGETHTAYGDHFLQLQVLQSLHAKDNNIAIGMEMFPRSAQPVLDKYITDDNMTEKDFIKQSRYFSVWGFDYRLYRDIIGFAKKHRLPIIGLNLDKRITSQVFREGHTDTLSEEDQATIAADRDLDVPGYRERLLEVHGQHGSSSHDNGFEGFIQAQALWDETMAETISNYLLAHPEKRMVIIAGNGHVYKDSAIPLRVERRMPQIRQSVLTTNNDMDTGREQGRQVDYLVFTHPVDLPPAPKVGVVLVEEKDPETEEPKQIRIVGISPHGKGTEAGLKEQDIIVSIDGTAVYDVADLKITLLDKAVGQTVTLEILRERGLLTDETLEIKVELSSTEVTAMSMGKGTTKPPGHP